MTRLNVLFSVLSWICVQNARANMESTTINVCLPEKECMQHKNTLQCEENNTVVIDELVYLKSFDGDECFGSHVDVDWNVTKLHEYLIREQCSSAHNFCDLSNLSILPPPGLHDDITAFCIVITHSCVPDEHVKDMCSNFTEESSNDMFLTLDKTQHLSHISCSCNLTASTIFSLTAREIVFYDDSRNCFQTVFFVSFPGNFFWDAGCNGAYHEWPYYSVFNKTLFDGELLTNGNVNLLKVISGAYPTILIQLHGTFNIACETFGTMRPSLPTTGPPDVSDPSRPNSPSNMLPTTIPVDLLMTNEPTETTSPDWTELPTEPTSASLTNDDDIIYIASSIGGVFVIVGSAIFVFIIVCRRRRLTRLKTDHIQLQEGRDNPYYSTCGDGDNKNTPKQYNQTTNIDVRSDTVSACQPEHSQWEQSRNVKGMDNQQAYINVKLIKQENKYATPRIERKTPIFGETADPSDSASAYDHITLMDVRITRPTSDVYSYDHLRKDTETYHTTRDKGTDNSDETYDHLGKAKKTYHTTHDKGTGNSDETYDHLGKDTADTYPTTEENRIYNIEETHDHLNANPTNAAGATPVISDDCNTISKVAYAYDNSFGGKCSTNTGMDNYDHVEKMGKLYKENALGCAPNKATPRSIDTDRKFNITEPCRKDNAYTCAETTSFVNPGKAKTEDTTPTCRDQKNLNHQYFILEPKV